ncbi:hypothetical protein ABK040_000980 [Willaertia magna]
MMGTALMVEQVIMNNNSSKKERQYSTFHQDHVIQNGTLCQEYSTNVSYLRNVLRGNNEHEQNINFLLNEYKLKYNDVTIRLELAKIRKQLVEYQQSFVKKDKTILSTSNVKQALEGSQFYLNNPNERKLVLTQRNTLLLHLSTMYKEAREYFILNDNNKESKSFTIHLDIHLMNMWIDIYLRLRDTKKVWEIEEDIREFKLEPNKTTLIFLTDACRIEGNVSKAIDLYKKANLDWDIDLDDASYWNHLLSCFAFYEAKHRDNSGTYQNDKKGKEKDEELSKNAKEMMKNEENTLEENNLVLKYFSIMLERGVKPDEDTFRFVIIGCRNIQSMMGILKIMELNHNMYYLKCYESIAHYLGNIYEPDIVNQLFRRLIKNRNKFRDIRSYSKMALDNSIKDISGNSLLLTDNEENITNVMEFDYSVQMELTNIFEQLLFALTADRHIEEKPNIELILNIYDYAVTKEKLKPTTRMLECLLDAYCKSEMMNEAWTVLKKLRTLKLFNSNSTRCHYKLFMAYKKANDLRGMLTVVKDAVEHRVRLTPVFIDLFVSSTKSFADLSVIDLYCTMVDAEIINVKDCAHHKQYLGSVLWNVKVKHSIFDSYHHLTDLLSENEMKQDLEENTPVNMRYEIAKAVEKLHKRGISFT